MLGLPWGTRKRLSEPDAALMLALSIYEGSLCRCGCEQWAEIAHDADTDGWWEVDESTFCYAGAALEKWRSESSGSTEPGQLIHVELMPDYTPTEKP